MAKAKKRRARASRPRHASAVHNPRPRRTHRRTVARRRHTPNPVRRRVVVMRRRKGNPTRLGGSSIMKRLEKVAAGIASMGLNNVILAQLPATVTSSTAFSVGASAAIALASGYLVRMWDKEIGDAVEFGGLMNSAKLAFDAMGVSPSIGLGDFVSGKFAVPQNPIYDANMSVGGGPGEHDVRGGPERYRRPSGGRKRWTYLQRMVGVAHRVTRPGAVRTGGLEAVGGRRQGIGGGCGGCNAPPSIHANKGGGG